MAFFSACKPYFKPYSNTTSSSPGKAVGKLIQVDVTPNFAEGSLYADDNIAEYKKRFSFADVVLNTSTLPLDVAKEMFSLKTNSTNPELIYAADSEGVFGSFGFVYGEVIDDVTKYNCDVLLKVKFDLPAESYKTQGESIEFGTPTINGRAYVGTYRLNANDKMSVWKIRGSQTGYNTLTEAITRLENILSGTNILHTSGTDEPPEIIPGDEENPEET